LLGGGEGRRRADYKVFLKRLVKRVKAKEFFKQNAPVQKKLLRRESCLTRREAG